MMLLFCALYLLNYVVVESQNAGAGVYGIAGPNYVDGGSSLIQIDVNSGKITTIIAQNDISHPILTGQNLGCFDNVHNIYYFISAIINGSSPTGQTTVLYGYNLSDPSNKMDVIKLFDIKAGGIIGVGDACIANPSNGDLFVFGHDANNNQNQLLLKLNMLNNKLNIQTVGNYEKIDDPPLLAGDPTILDNERNMLWVAGTRSGQEMYFYINITNGELINNVNFHQYPLIAGSIYNNKYDRIIGVEFDDYKNGLYEFNLVFADSVNLNVTKKFEAAMIGYCGQMKCVTEDNENEILYSLMLNNSDCNTNYTDDVYLVGTDIKSGAQLTSVRIAQIDGVLNTAPQDIQYWNGK